MKKNNKNNSKRTLFLVMCGLFGAVSGVFVAMHVSYGQLAELEINEDVLPRVPGRYSLGNLEKEWIYVNGIMYFSNGQVGIGYEASTPFFSGTNLPRARLDVKGGVKIRVAPAPMTCNVDKRGGMWIEDRGSNATDTVKVCIKEANGTYAWSPIYYSP